MQFLAFEEKLIHLLINESMGEKEQVKLKFGFYIVVDSLKKGTFVYIPAIILDVFWQVLLVHISFLFIRQVTYGWHCSTHKGCTIGSVIVFTIIPYIVKNFTASPSTIYILGCILFCMVYILGPIETPTNHISEVKKYTLKRQLSIRLSLLVVIGYLISTEMFLYVVVGVTIQLSTLLIQYVRNEGVCFV